ncbi:MAG: thioredoxin family protein [Candidatus Hydrogenedentota bacterium]|nr:MAG: thioredoxin family protein [Candidatus Hydrogenedentota bacterium]
MALLESLQIPLGTKMPEFTLKDAHGKQYTSQDLMGENGLLVIFSCNHCPYAQAVWPRLVKLSKFLRENGIGVVAINPNIHPDYPEDDPKKMPEYAKKWGIDFPYLVDDTQSVAKQFKAQCTPDLYLYDKNQKLYYHGRLDDNWQNPDAVKEESLKIAAEKMLANEPPPEKQYPSMGCSIKWRDS